MLHVYWAIGGMWWKGNALPTVEGQRAFMPGTAMIAGVAVGLFVFAVVHVLAWATPPWAPRWATQAALFAIGCIFIIRAIGERATIGFFKRVKNTDFAYYDTRIYSPLCLVVGGNALVLWYFL